MPAWPTSLDARLGRATRALIARLVVGNRAQARPLAPAALPRRSSSSSSSSRRGVHPPRAHPPPGPGSAGASPPIPGATPLPRDPTAGRIEIITGPMFAGKSTELLRRVAAHEAAGRTVLVFASAADTRYAPGGGAVATHGGAVRPTPAAGPTLAAAAAAAGGPAALAAADVLAIDEAQFFPDLVPFATAAADEAGQTVLVAGLDGDFRRRPFGGLPALLPHADCVTKLAAACAVCGGPAHFSVRLASGGEGDGSGPQVEVGGAERYAAVCRAHYRAATAGRAEVEAAGKGRGGGGGGGGAPAPPATV